ncbi:MULTISPECIES: ABC transporter ATP-binding protein [Micromonospora]|uniref:Sn-glycerol-3-phosphate import ATP-binding prote in UgpC n=1 Tax=Micromonospora noduli TaxID=709876 RepID=A0ABX9D3E9_9ACTN|nr:MULTISPECIES: ABC transporter ATP-binding protein [Micromonospora]RAO21031.1 sn-glycerol-3-phosphate import ATP-binding prote in UgpC [Micromonospora noduli]RAO21324.1 sn-glycerol-3-phosphate import ATP-binding prote in UgpC [Micromonospora noduli]RAO28560.1 sn-glycerol-3-phosphate import ATP-binding prote in UgpC [Micromonospora noduli]RAO39793.1 sn-glycerol-3-phosphate import ATP-binding prote in UgpC [Micromonospora noduli]
MSTVTLKDVTKVFRDGTLAVDSINLDVNDGEFMVLLGPSGCGKSTVLRMIAGLEEPTTGAVMLDGEVANDLPPRDRRIAMVFQDFALYPHMTVGDNIAFPLRLAGVEPEPRGERVSDVASALGIGDVLARKPGQLSGGQRQRVAMGRAIVRRPGLFLMDEPLSNLDSGLRAELRAEISGLTRELGVTTVYVTHDQAEALTMADRVAIMRRGVLQDVGTPTQVYGRPATLYVAAFLGSPRMNLLEASVYVHLDRYVTLNLGDQSLYLPWNDIRSRAVAHYHGERIVVGMRAEALTPVAPDSPGDVLRGRIRYLEHHGHESLAFLDIGATAIVVDEMGAPLEPPPVGQRGLRRFGSVMQRLTGKPVEAQEAPASGVQTSVLPDPGRHHRRPAELAVRLAPYPAVSAGHPLAVSVRMDALHFFDERGDRIDVGWR